MAIIPIIIDSIIGGQQPTEYAGGSGQFLTSIGIDPDLPVDLGSSHKKAGGVITPAPYEKFSSTVLNAAPMWILTNPKDTKVYVYLDNGRIVSYSNILASETNVGTPTSGAGNGAAYYNNYLYFATPTDISRYGPLDGSPSLTNTVWTGATLGSQTALVDTTYPTHRSVSYPNHAMHVHTDNKLYFSDFKDGKGIIHFIKTTKVTNEGDTDDGSTYNSLDLPFGYLPTDIESWGTDIVISAIQTTDPTISQGPAALFFWDTVADSFYRKIDVPDPLITALLNFNGVLSVFAGNANDGMSRLTYSGGFTLSQRTFLSEGNVPFAGAVDGYGGRISWGGNTTDSATAACVLSTGYKHSNLPADALNNIIRATGTGSTPVISSIKYLNQASGVTPRVVVGWRDGTSAYGLDKVSSSATQNSVWRSKLYNVGKPFTIKKIRLPLTTVVATNQTVTPKIYLDDLGTTKTLNVINNTNYPNSERNIVLRPEINGEHNFFLELAFTGTAMQSVGLPIEIEIETKND